METLVWLVILAVVAGAAWYFWPRTDTNKDGKVDINDAVANVKAEADVNKDGKVNVADVEVVAAKVEEEIKAEVKKVAAKVKKAADVNKDGTVNKADAKSVVKKVTAKNTTKK